ncbi:hypothetical protein SAMIE_1018330 [Sphingobium amiense]|uniref:Uncharacterized protein n=1 Tax=Sphingobium amiense TaxID=135719 RepID=A0A494WCK3_9SPHN|nr:hypothetical protein [Sphingobium amiense]BBD98332.1 hypothetical protein SAMIE_1018330 [Sphingobium amiense]
MTAPASPVPAKGLEGRWLLVALAGWLGVDQLLLWRFLGMPGWTIALGGAAAAGLLVWLHRASASLPRVSTGALALSFAAAFLLMLLGGEGRFFYANIDWQVRYAVMRDMSAYPWPFVYTARGLPELLRGPIGMFFAPALAAKALGARAGDIALLTQNSFLIGSLLALGSTLFGTRRAKITALIVVVLFSGLDAVGRILFRGGLSDHIENWAYLQYSSTITLAFWVPPHAISGWVGALGFLLWRAGKLPPGPFLALLPLTALWSPLGLIGAMPFAALAGVRTLAARSLRGSDIALPALASLIAAPGLLYLAAAGGEVGARLQALPPVQWGAFELLEILVYVAPLAFLVRSPRFGRDTLAVLTVWLLLAPFVQIGASSDFPMRASISALMVLAAMVADGVNDAARARPVLIGLIAIGSITGFMEVRRALIHPPAPQVRCDLFDAWKQSFGDFPVSTYVAPLDAVPALVRPADPARVSPPRPARCWDGHWYSPDEASG